VDEPDDARIDAQLARVSAERWEAIATALAAVEAHGRFTDGWSSTAPKFPGDTNHFPFPLYTEAVRALVGALGESGLTVRFSWMDWPGFTEHWAADRFAHGTAADAARLVTTALRGERFSDGFLENLLEGGVLQAAVRRLLDGRPTPS
jgi:hypothetical protein